MSDSGTQWLVDLYEEHGTSLHRLVVLLGAESESGHILRGALMRLARRAHRLVDPLERVEFLAEEVVHDARSMRGPMGTLTLPELEDPRQQEIQAAVTTMPVRMGEALVVSHYLSIFGPELAGVLRMTLRSSNHKMDEALKTLRLELGDTAAGGVEAANAALSAELTSALRASARLVQPSGTETLEAELRGLNNFRRRGLALPVAIPLLVVAMGLGFWIAVATAPASIEAVTPPTSSAPAPTASSSRSLPAQVRGVPVYYVGTADKALYRELRNLAATGDLVRAAIDAIFVVPPRDPDYSSPWENGQVVDVEQIGHVLTLNLTASSFEKLTTKELAQPAIDQMVYTASELLGDPELKVVFLADGQAPPELLQSPDGFGRRGLEPMPAIWLSSPENKANLEQGQLVIEGKVKPQASAPLVRVLDENDKVVTSTTAQTATDPDSTGWRSWKVVVTLTPGTYSLLAVTEVENPLGPELVTESKKVVVS